MEGLPDGTVTFLFTDIESSSARWEADAVEMGAVLRRHDELLREVITGHDGCVFKHLGDGMCAAFPSAPAAVAAAEAVVGMLAEERWPAGRSLWVRLGLHTGAVSPVGGDYFGPVVNRAARVMGAANGGQIVCSAATVALCSGRAFQDAGEHELAGVGLERLFVLVGVGGGADRPLRTDSTVRHNLPVELSSFVGRVEEMRELAAAVSPRRLVTLVGPGGVGKTRLAIETAQRLGDRPDGVWLCELAAVVDGDGVAATVADTIGARHQAGVDLVDAIAMFLQRRRGLVVLDNCEHVLDAVVRLARRLLSLEGVAVLATSRELLGVRGEQLWPVAPLDASAAVELFVDRCRQQDPHFVLDADELRAAEEISRRLDGIPLALELAAARTTALSPTAIATRLGDRFRLLRGGRRGERHQTLRDTLQWSYDLLSPAEAALFDRLAVFSGGFTLTAAEMVCADGVIVEEADVIDVVVALVDKSMVQRDRSTADRFTLLETLRQYGEEQLYAKGHISEYRDRHAKFFRDLAIREDGRMFGPAEVESWAVLTAEWDNLRSAFSYMLQADDLDSAAALVRGAYFFALHAMRYELGDWVVLLLERAEAAALPGAAGLSGVRAWQAWSTGDLATGVRSFDAAAERHSLDPVFFFSTIVAYLQLDDLPRAERAAMRLLDAADRSDGRSMFCAAIAQPYYLSSARRAEEAISWADRALSIASEVGSQSCRSRASCSRPRRVGGSQTGAAGLAARIRQGGEDQLHARHRRRRTRGPRPGGIAW